MLFQGLFRQRRPKIVGRKLYEAVVAQARQPAFYTAFGAPDTVEGRFELYCLHVILLLHRLKGGGEEAAETAQALFDTFLSGLDNALREIGVGDLSVAKKMRKLGEAFFGRAKAYDTILDGDRADELIGLIRRTVFEEAASDGRPDTLAAYVRRASATLAGQPLEAILDGQVAWPEPGS